MASGSQNMTTYNARTVTGSNSAASPAGALLLSGAGRADDATGDTWIFLDGNGGTNAPWGIKHDQVNNKIHIYGSNTDSVWTRMNTGDTYILGKVGIGYNPEESENSYKLYVNGTSNLNGATFINGTLATAAAITAAYSGAHLYLKNTQWVKGTIPSSQSWSAVEYVSNDSSNNRIALLETTLDTSGNSQFNILLVPNVANSTSWSGIVLKKTSDNVLTVSIAGNTSVTGSVSASTNITTGTYILAGTYLQAKNHIYMDAGSLQMKYNNEWYEVVKNHNNGNITINAASAVLYLGYQTTTSLNFMNGKATMNNSGHLTAPKFIGALQGNADTATALTSNAGNGEQPIYFTGGKPAATSYAIKATVNAASVKNTFAYYSNTHEISSYPRIRNIGSARYPIDIYLYNDAGNAVAELWYDSGDATNFTLGRWNFLAYSPKSTADKVSTGKYEYFYLPDPTKDRTSNASYAIRTSKNDNYTVSNATTAASCTGNAATVSRATFGDASNGEHNANNITSNGLYYYNSNGPATSQGAKATNGALYAQAYSTSWVGQIAQDYSNGYLFVRGKNNNSWTSWLHVLNTDTGVSRYHVGSTASNSYILVTINPQTGWMLNFTLKLYQSYVATDIQISGYNYGSNHWHSPQAIILGSTSTGAIKVYFGYTANYALWVAVDGGQYNGADVVDMCNGYTQIDPANAFTLTKVNSLPGTIQTTVTAYRPWYRNETVSNASYATTSGSCSGNAATATTAASCSGNSATATRINGALAAATSNVDRNIWVSSTASADGIPNYISGFSMNPSTKFLTVPAGTRISPSAGNLYLGNSGNQGWVYIQDMCSQDGQKWKIHQAGSAEFTGTVNTGHVKARDGMRVLSDSTSGNCAIWFYNAADSVAYWKITVSSDTNNLVFARYDNGSLTNKFWIKNNGTTGQSSSRFIKHNIQDITLDTGFIIDKMQPVSYIVNGDPTNKTTYGFIYEDLVQILPNVCDNDNGNVGITYTAIIPILTKEIQNLRKRIASMELELRRISNI